MPYLNIHTHFPTNSPDSIAVQSEALVPQSTPKEAVAAYASWGLHPWYLDGWDWETAAAQLLERANAPNVIAIGECGLDKVVKTDWARQLAAFRVCLHTAQKLEKPVIVHCVRAYEEVLACWKSLSQPRPTLIFHGFDKHPQTAKMLLAAGCFLSFGGALFKPNSHAAAALRDTPLERLFLETDYDPSLSIQTVYARAAALKGLEVGELEDGVVLNFQEVFRQEVLNA